MRHGPDAWEWWNGQSLGAQPVNRNADDPRSLRRLEDGRFLRGAGRYVDDLPAAGHLHALFVRSPHAHAEVLGIRTGEAAAMPGVRGVFTMADLLADGVRPVPCAMALPPEAGLVVPPRHALAHGRVRHVGSRSRWWSRTAPPRRGTRWSRWRWTTPTCRR